MLPSIDVGPSVRRGLVSTSTPGSASASDAAATAWLRRRSILPSITAKATTTHVATTAPAATAPDSGGGAAFTGAAPTLKFGYDCTVAVSCVVAASGEPWLESEAAISAARERGPAASDAPSEAAAAELATTICRSTATEPTSRRLASRRRRRALVSLEKRGFANNKTGAAGSLTSRTRRTATDAACTFAAAARAAISADTTAAS